MIKKTDITRDDILNMPDYEQIRDKRRSEIAKIKENRRLAVGPHASFYFECYETMWYQIHEMLRIEKGGEGQIQDEIKVYNSLIPKGTELVIYFYFVLYLTFATLFNTKHFVDLIPHGLVALKIK
jgi:hypothetical protein